MPHTTIVRIEQGRIAAPRPDELARLATALGFTTAEPCSPGVGDVHATDLPDLRTCLRANYPGLPEAAIDELGERVGRLTSERPTPARGGEQILELDRRRR